MTDTPQTTAGANPKETRVLEQHLDPGFAFSAEFDPETPYSDDAPRSSSNSQRAAPESSLQLQGGDIHRDLYKIAGQERRAKLHQRAATFSHPHEFAAPSESDFDHDELPIQDQLAPGGMRRQFLQRQSKRVSYISEPVTRNFISFLELYGNFAGEDLEETDDDEAIEEEEEEGERRPLLGRRQSSKRLREKGDASQLKTFFTLLKAFIGTGIMFLPKAFKNGGMLFSSITLIVVSAVTALCFELLLSCRKQYGGAGYGDLGRSISGPKLRALILVSVTLSQIGFVCAGIIFTADNLASFLDAVSKTKEPLSTNALIGIQLLVLIPLSFIRNISKLGPAALLADVFILIGLTYIYWFDFSWISRNGGFNSTIELFNPRDFTLTIGSAIFTFEGIGLILPIQSSMAQPEHFSKLLYLVMLIITVIFTSVGVLCYGTFGENVSVEVITNFPQTSKLVNAVQFLYSMAVLVGTPVQLFPAMRNIELKIFGRKSGKQSNLTKWKKNGFRTMLVLLTGLIAAVGASDLDKFVALIGSFACVPLVYIYPAYLHYKGVATRPWVKAGDVAMMVVGLVAMVYTTSITIARWAET
ncbi:transmembrane amino acid transporter protein-domain-containing protein [Paraphoma chrysanthemicola]|uniref:Transmembrane amino acid transporter protein-domain-containing protein n=1 Tax=Paraphoma chrysanthemicola TaxID=798071 RepID=A0A8K0QSN4_9PLEO|nr:transmembrane amino acid transporter protein-domain-containing protein [Paraphoma chrysanthemicola]